MNSLAYGSRNSRRIEPALRQQLLRIAMINEFVRQAQLQQRLDDASSRHRLGNR